MLIVALWLFFERTLAARPARHRGEPHRRAADGHLAPQAPASWPSALAAFIGALSGMLIAPTTTIYYDTGFLIGLKGFVGADHRRPVELPAGRASARLAVGLLEAFGSFWASAFKEVIVFTLILIPVLLWRSLCRASASRTTRNERRAR